MDAQHPVITVDERGRTSLARVRHSAYTQYTASEEEDGTIILTPAITVSPVELAILRTPAVVDALEAARTGGRSRMLNRPLPAFPH